MTLIQIITRALAELGRLSDSQSMDAWKERFTIYVNDGIRDVAEYLEVRRQDTVDAAGGEIQIADLQRDCVKVLGVKQNGSARSFTFAPESGKVLTNAQDGPVEVSYRFTPAELVNDTDVPDIPLTLQYSLKDYVIYRDYMTLDPSMQQRAQAYLQAFTAAKRKARKDLAEQDTFSIYNYGW